MRQAILTTVLILGLLTATLPAHAEEGCADTNKDGRVNAVDAARILQLVAGVYEPGDSFILHMWDADGDGDVESRDAVVVLQFYAGVLPELPQCLA